MVTAELETTEGLRDTMSTAPYIHPRTAVRTEADDSDASALLAIVSVLLGGLVAVLGFFAVMMWVDARNAKNSASEAAAQVASGEHSMANMPGMAGMSMPGMTASSSSAAGPLTSFAGAAPANADAL